MVQHFAEKPVRRTMANRRRFLDIARNVSATIGNEYFSTLATQLARALGADRLYIAEFVSGQVECVRTTAAYVCGEEMETFQMPLAGTPDAEVALDHPRVYSRGIQHLFPSDSRLSEWGAEAYVAHPLSNPEGRPVGLIAVLYRRPLGDEAVHFVQSILAMFAPRAAAELNRKRADDDLRESEQRYRAFITLNPNAMWRTEFGQPIATDLPEEQQLETMSQLGYIAECNDALARLVGFKRAEALIGKKLAEIDFGHAESIRRTRRDLIQCGYQFSTVETTDLDGTGKVRHWLISHWGIVENGMLQRIWGTAQDVTELRHGQVALADSEKRFTEILEIVKLIAIILDRNGSISFCNNYFQRLTGWTAEEVIGKNWFDLVVTPEEREQQRTAFASADSSSQASHQFAGALLGRDGRRHTIEWHYEILRDSAGGIVGAASIGHDVTEYRALEAQLRQSQKLETIGKLAGGVAHDFNNLLTVVRGYSAHLLEHMDPKDPAYSGLVEIRRAAEKGAALTHQLLAFSRRQPAQPQLLDLNELVAEDERMLRRLIGENIALTTDLGATLDLVRADAGHMHQVLLNLVVNARDAMPKGGKLIIALSNVEISEARDTRLSEIRPGRYVQLRVADTGIGMSEDVRDQIFEPFFTTKGPGAGTGLGLSTVYGIIRQSEGYIVVDTKPGEGTAFEIFLPSVQPPEAAPAEAEVTPTVCGGTETILLVEDQQEVRAILGTLLRSLGYTVLQANGGDQALRIIKRRRLVHLLVTDVVMPGMSGTELAERVKALRPKTKILYMTGYFDALQQPAVVYMQKSFPPEALAAKVREILDQP
jgi:PAS domain S-box-containing protein